YIAEQDEQAHAGGEEHEALAAVADDGLGLSGDEAVNRFGGLLNGIWPLYAQRDPGQNEKDQENAEDQDLHAEGIADRSRWRLRLNVQGVQKRHYQTTEEVVQERG